MNFDWKKALTEIAPVIGGAISGPFSPLVKAGISTVSQVLLGKHDGTEEEIAEAVEKGLPPEVVAEIKKADQEFIINLRKLDNEREKITAEDRANARDMQKAALQQDDKVAKRFIYEYATFITGVTFVYIFAITFMDIPKENVRFADTVLGFLLGIGLATIISFFFGSSSGSSEKTSVIAGLLNKVRG